MNSNAILIIFILEFTVLAVWAAYEKNWPQALYGFGGAILNIAVLWMGIK